jgi:cyclopropane fatty-acyl-phospholipid synthase-like methyltransferase
LQPLDLYAKIEEYLDFEEEVKYLHNTIKSLVLEKKPDTHIDIGCGQGEFSKDLNSLGIKTLGVDLSKKQIQIATSKGIDAKCIDIADIEEKFDLATAIFDVINYLPNEYIKTFLQNSYNLLNPNGYFIFDVNTLFGFEEVAQGTLTIDVDDKFIAIDANF